MDLSTRIEALSIPEPNSGCWIWLAQISRFGYGQIMVSPKKMKAHRAAWIAYRGEIPDGTMVLHSCDNRSCVNPDHLFLGDQSANMSDMWGKGRHPGGGAKGAGCHWSKLSEKDVLAIRRSTAPITEIMRLFGVSRSYAYALRSRKTWRHI